MKTKVMKGLTENPFERRVLFYLGNVFIPCSESEITDFCSNGNIYVVCQNVKYVPINTYLAGIWYGLKYIPWKVRTSGNYLIIQLKSTDSKHLECFIDRKVKFNIKAVNEFVESTGEFEQTLEISIQLHETIAV